MGLSGRAPVTVDVSLIAAAQQGDRAAFGELYARYARMVHGVLLARVPPDAVEDLVQDVFLQALQRLPALREVEAFGGWLAAIARNRATDHVRRAPPAAVLPAELVADRAAAQEPDRLEALAILALIQTLPDAYRETLVLRLVEGFTGPEIAAATGLTEGSVRVNLHRGMKQLRERIAARERVAAASGREAARADDPAQTSPHDETRGRDRG